LISAARNGKKVTVLVELKARFDEANNLQNILEFAGKRYQCAVGKNGFAVDKHEGDNCSPIGTFPLREVYYRFEKPQTNFPLQRNEPLQGKWMKFDNDLWFEAGIKDGVYRFDGQTLNYLAFPPHKVLNTSDNLFAATDISKGKDNMIWFATYAGVFGYNGSTFTIINDETLGFDRKIEPLHIRSIFEDSKGRLWIGNNGIGVLLKEGDSIINFSKKNNLIHPNSKRKGDKSPQGTLEHVFTIAEDNKGNIWFGDRDAGIWKYDGKAMKNYAKIDGMTNDFALSIYEDKNGELWFGMADGSIYKLNGQTFEKQF
jgi:ligand-binding sensor domain-containing protein